MNYHQYPVSFMGKDTGKTAVSKAGAAVMVWHWLRTCPDAPEIPPEYKERRYGVSMGRLRKHVRLEGGVIHVTLGLPDRRLSWPPK